MQNFSYKILGSGRTLVIDEHADIEKVVANKCLLNVLANTKILATQELSASLFPKIYTLLKEGSIELNPIEILPNGLNGVANGLKKLEKGVSNVKLVVQPQDTV
ncbi:hypothetical protein C8Q72DRAFT_796397 [Fomitopsis betulina]|nr:hypothetical protein C8Q72DRAFT_796397 [Fomitopsis betulina]